MLWGLNTNHAMFFNLDSVLNVQKELQKELHFKTQKFHFHSYSNHITVGLISIKDELQNFSMKPVI